jgi:endonuclease/exonuclease/phosphatase family metal-dependent hydrolase
VTSLRLLTYNIRYGGAGREERLISTIAACQPDIVLLQEATRAAVVERLAGGTGMVHWATFRRQSLGFLSRVPIEHYEWHRPRPSRHAFLEVVPAGTSMRVFGVHLSAVHAAWTERRRVFEVRALLKSIERHQTGLHVLAGDFNTLAPGEVLDSRRLPPRLRPFVWLSGGRIRWRTIQEILDKGYVDAYKVVHPADPGFTFPAADPHIRLDYMFLPRAFTSHLVTCAIVSGASAPTASDHLPLFAEVRL